MNTQAHPSPDHQLARAFHTGNLPAMRAWIAIGTSQEARNGLLDDVLLGYRMAASCESCSRCASAAALLVEAGAAAQCAWVGITRRFLDELIAKHAAKEAA
ncbi:MAG TPA: hypothetical protein PK080_00355 [Hyphomonadaceae bacterium]|nr:hypothetical protein [Hyphomonadaceae bacterium]